jgi:hypothetical protein
MHGLPNLVEAAFKTPARGRHSGYPFLGVAKAFCCSATTMLTVLWCGWAR